MSVDVAERLRAALADRYTVERELGAGGMATVYLADDLRHQRRVAIKVLRPELAAVIGAERFLAEIRTTANLQHPHILPLFDSGEADGLLFYVMPYVEGESLGDLLAREKQLSVEDAVSLAVGAASALDYAHRHDVIHRDIKPANILLHDGAPLVADFGIALALTHAGGSRLTETGLSLGTPHYMSPEQATADRELTARSDVYALGCVLYEMLVGEPPHTGPSAHSVLAKLLTEEVRPARELRRSVPAHVDWALSKALEKLPADRFDTAASFAEALRPQAAFVPAVDARPSRDVGFSPARREAFRPEAWPLVAVVLAAVAAWGWLRPGPAPSAAPVSRSTLVLPEGHLIGGDWPRQLALSPDGSVVAYEGAGRLWTRRLDELAVAPLVGTEGGALPAFSPDGRSLAFLHDGSLRVIRLEGGPATTIVADAVAPPLTWGPDDWLYFGRGEELVIYRVPATGGKVEVLLDERQSVPAGGVYLSVEVLRDGAGLLVTRASFPDGEPHIRVVAVASASGSVRERPEGLSTPRYVSGERVAVAREDGALLVAPLNLPELTLAGPGIAMLEGLRGNVWSIRDFAVSRTGTLIYRALGDDDSHELVWVDEEGRRESMDPDWRDQFVEVDLSPDGTSVVVQIAHNAAGFLWVKRLPDGPPSLLTPGRAGFGASFTPDGGSVVFRVMGETFTESRDLVVQPVDGSTAPESLLDLPGGVEGGFVSRDGEWLIFTTGGEQAGDVLALRTSGDGAPTAVAATESHEWEPALSSDGRWLAYVSDETGRREVFVVPFPGPADAKWQISTTGGRDPRWAHDGSELFYTDPEAGRMVAVDIEPGPSFSRGAARELFSLADYMTELPGRSYDVGSDGRLLMIRRGDPGHVILVQNWLEEVRDRSGEGGGP